MLIDSHVHLFPEKLFQAIWSWFDKHGWEVRYKIQAKAVVEELKRAGVERFFLLNYAHKPGISSALNHWTHEFSKTCPEAVPFGAIHPDDDNVAGELDRCFREYCFRGIKFHCHVTAIRPDDPRMFPIYEKMIEHDRLLILHAGTGPSLRGYKETTQDISGVRFVRPILKQFPGLKVVIPHLGADEFDAFFDLLEEFPNLLLDTTMVLAGYFPVTIPWEKIEKYSGRILYGSDFPNIPYDLMTEIEAIRHSGLSPLAQERLLCSNAEKLIR